MTASLVMRVECGGANARLVRVDSAEPPQELLDASPSRVCEAVEVVARDLGRPVRVEVQDATGDAAWAVTVHPDGSTVDLVLASHPRTAGAGPGPRKKGPAPAPARGSMRRLIVATAVGIAAAVAITFAITTGPDGSPAAEGSTSASTAAAPTSVATAVPTAQPEWRADAQGGPGSVEVRLSADPAPADLRGRVSLWRDGLPQHSAPLDITSGTGVAVMRGVAPGVWVWRASSLGGELAELTGRVLVLPRGDRG